LLIKGVSPRERALESFSQLRIWDTERNNGVLICLLLADHAIEILADRGIDKIVETSTWQAICREMQEYFINKDFRGGVMAGIVRISDILVKHFPRDDTDENELSNKPQVLQTKHALIQPPRSLCRKPGIAPIKGASLAGGM